MRRTPILATVALALVLAGCSSPAQTESTTDDGSSSSVPAATGDRLDGDGYSYNVPEGWGIPEGTEIPTGVDTAAADVNDTDGFADNINVVINPEGDISPEDIETAAAQQLEGSGATEVEVGERTEIAGAETAQITALLESGGATYRIDQYYPNHDGQTYVVTLSFNETVSEADRDEIAQSVFATWEWA
ncbi:hypothetical protein [Microbacterium sp. P05]|uniref:hypothetical protein n=1 Tax=Microbacterium sp. P05 TaxID=3366948 RepID=UPI003745A2CA